MHMMNVPTVCPILLLSSIPLYGYTGHLGYFQFGAIMKKAIVNFLMHKCLGTYTLISLKSIPWSSPRDLGIDSIPHPSSPPARVDVPEVPVISMLYAVSNRWSCQLWCYRQAIPNFFQHFEQAWTYLPSWPLEEIKVSWLPHLYMEIHSRKIKGLKERKKSYKC